MLMGQYGFNFDTTYTNLPNQLFTELKPETVISPSIVVLNKLLAESMGLDFSDLSQKKQAEIFSGNQLPKGSTPFSQAYAGHQFGHFAILGDGRAHLWGEVVTPLGERFDLQFKGSGRTPYSRRGDGKAVLNAMLREYIISEAMHYLGIPTTRSLAVVKTGEPIMRNVILPGAILTRVASSHIRIGTFEFASSLQDKKVTSALIDYTVERHYPDLTKTKNKALELIYAAMKRQINLIVDWMRVGFIHGVMNTDNMTLSGETIDYGPCAFMDTYDENTVFSSIDHGGRYAYANQPKIAQWNLARFAETLLPFIDDDIKKSVSLAKEIINQFQEIYNHQWLTMMCSKLGLFNLEYGDKELAVSLLDWMHENQADYTNTFYDLSQVKKPSGKLYEQKQFEDWYLRWRTRLSKNTKSLKLSVRLMRKNNPVVIPRNHKVEQALEAANLGDLDLFKALLTVLKEPYRNRKLPKSYQVPPERGELIYQTFCGT